MSMEFVLRGHEDHLTRMSARGKYDLLRGNRLLCKSGDPCSQLRAEPPTLGASIRCVSG